MRRAAKRAFLAATVSAALLAGGLAGLPSAGAATLANPTLSVTSTVTGAANVSYTYSFTTATTSSLSSVTMTVPAGTSGSPSVGTVSGVPAGGSVSLDTATNTLTYSFTSSAIGSGTTVSIQVKGLTNTATAASSTLTVATMSGAVIVDSANPAPLSIAAGSASQATWSVAATSLGAPATYSYSFTTATSALLSAVTMTVPPGTTGTPAVGLVAGVPGAGSIALAGNLLTYSFSSTAVGANAATGIQVTGLTNTTSAGTYSAEVATVAASGPVDAGISNATALSTGLLADPSWSVSNATTSANGVTYRYSATTATSATLTSVTMTLPPGTSGTPTLGSVSGVPGGGTLSLGSELLTYSFSGTSVPGGTPVALSVSGLINPSDPQAFSSEMATGGSSTPVDAGLTAAVAMGARSLAGPLWSASSTTAGVGGVTYTYIFTTASAETLQSLTATVPPGTGGTPAAGAVSGLPSGGSVSLDNGLLTYSFSPTSVGSGTAVSVQISGLTNTAARGAYSANLATVTAAGPAETAETAAVSFGTGALSSLSFAPGSLVAGASSQTYTFGFKTATTGTLTSITMAVPPGTGGSPVLGAVTGFSPSGTAASLSSNLLTVTFTAVSVAAGTSISVAVGGLVNTAALGSYTSLTATNTTLGPLDTGASPGFTVTGGTVPNATWTSSSTTTGAGSATYRYGFITASTSVLSKVQMTLPAGTPATTLTVGPVTGLPPGTASIGGTTLSYTFTSTQVTTGTTVSLQISGFTNTSTSGSFTSILTTFNGTAAVDSGTTNAVGMVPGTASLSALTWSASSTTLGAGGVSYTFGFTTDSSASHTLTRVTMTVPPGTGGTPTVGTVTGCPTAGSSVALSTATDTLTYSFSSASVPASRACSVSFAGLTNTSTAGFYSSVVTTLNGATLVDSGVTAATTLPLGGLSGTSWTTSSTKTSTTGATYTYEFSTATTANLTSVTLTVPSGTGSAGLTAKVFGLPSGGTITLASGKLAYVFTSTSVAGGTNVVIQVSGLTNTATAGASTSTVSTLSGTATVDSGVTNSVTFSSTQLSGLSWTSTTDTAGDSGASYTFKFTVATTASLTKVTLTVPSGTGGTPTIGSVSGLPTAGNSISLAASTLTYAFSGSTVASGTAATLIVNGLVNTSTGGNYVSSIATFASAVVEDTGVTNQLTVLPVGSSVTFTNTCGSTASCSLVAPVGGGTALQLLVIPGAGAPVSAAVVLGVQSNASGGYRVQTQSTALTSSAGSTLGGASTAGAASPPTGLFYATATLSASGGSGAALCSPYGTRQPYVGYSTSTETSVWGAPAPTGTGTDTVTLTDAVQVPITQPAGTYTGTISYLVQPSVTVPSTC